MKSIILLMAYFGKLPSYFDVWLRSVENNPTVDFCLITDCIDEMRMLPANVKLERISFSDFSEKLRNKIPCRIKIHNYGRVSQFRPAFGYVFDSIVKDYDFWGYLECDIILGDIREFLTDQVLEKHEKFFKLGHFQLFRNIREMNELFLTKTSKALTYQFAFRRNIIYFEEIIGIYNLCVDKCVKIYDKYVFTDVDFRYFYFIRSDFAYEDVQKCKCLFEYKNGKLFEIFVDESNILRKREILYVHLQKRNMEVACENYDRYLIAPNVFTNYSEMDTILYERIMEDAEIFHNEVYSREIQKLRRKMRNNNLKNPDWWFFYLLRVRLKHKGCIGLSGKKREI